MIFFSKTETASTQTADALLCLMPPIFESNGGEIPFSSADGKYTAEGFAAEDEVEALGDGLFRVRDKHGCRRTHGQMDHRGA